MTQPDGDAPPPPEQRNQWQAPPPGSGGGGFQSTAIEPGPAPGIVYADLVTRVVAFVIDGLILGVAYAILQSVLLVFGGWGSLLIAGLVYAAGSAAYFVYTWTTMRASLGQRVLGLETVNASDGSTQTQEQAIRRWAFLYGPFALAQVLGYGGGFLLGALGGLVGLLALLYAIYLLYTAAQSTKRQGFHDVQAGTVVVKRVAA